MFRALTIAVTVAIVAPVFQANAQSERRPTGTWASQGTGDCSGKDWASSDGVLPDGAKCATQTNGRIAVCWDGVTHKNPSRPGAWCTYKTVAPNECRGGGNPGVMYQCRATIVTAPPPASPVPPPSKPPIGPTASPPPASSAAAGTPGWVPRGFGDCTGNDWASSDGLKVDPAKCSPQTAGRIAVCWNQVTYKGPSRPGPWCTYKTVSLEKCTGGSNPGYLFECRSGAAAFPTATATPPAAPSPGPTASSPPAGQPSLAQAPAVPPAGPAASSPIYDPPVATAVMGMPGIGWDECKARLSAALAEHRFGNLRDFGNGWLGFAQSRSTSVACVPTSAGTVVIITTAGRDVAGERDRLLASIRRLPSQPQPAPTPPPAATQDPMRFPTPTFNGYPVSNCTNFGGVGCGQPAANRFCQSAGYSRATEYKIAYGGTPWVWDIGKACDDPGCAKLVDVVCTRR